MATKPKYKMSRQQRAKQFAPFDALSGFGSSIADEGFIHTRIERKILSEEESFTLNRKLCALKKGNDISLTYYENGHYHVIMGRLNKLDEVYRYLLVNDTRINFDDIYDIDLEYVREEDF